jgi:hypothetical protein
MRELDQIILLGKASPSQLQIIPRVKMQMSIANNVRSVSRRMGKVQREQLPFAVSKTLNDMAFAARKQIVGKTWPSDVTVRNTRFMSAILRVDKATKRNLTARLFDAKGRDYLERLTKGGVKTPRGRHLAIPGRDFEGRTSTGKIRKSHQPRNLLSGNKAYKVKTKSGTTMILHRKSKKAPLKVAYILKPRASIRRQFSFYEDAMRVARRTATIRFRKNLRAAVRTRRR